MSASWPVVGDGLRMGSGQSAEFPTGVKEVESVPFSMNVGCDIIGVASPEGRHR
jgi:hypothetical protein